MAPLLYDRRLYCCIVLCVILLSSATKGGAHVGKPCNSIIKICLASNSYCDDRGICRCKPHYPVNVAPHTCKKAARYSEQCDFTEQCTYYDNNTYCTQISYRSTCECYDGFLYSTESNTCKPIREDHSRNTNSILPTAIGLSLAFASVLCCILVLWHICRKQSGRSQWNQTPAPPTAPESTENVEPFLSVDETLPNYDAASSLKEDPGECEPPPSYEEVIGHMEEFSKA